MEPRQARRIFALSAALVVVTMALWFDPPASPETRIEVFEPLAEIDRIEIVRADGRVGLVQRGDHWWVTGTLEQRADESEVRRLVDAIEGLQYADPVAVPDEVDPEEFGLGEVPWATVRLEGPDGQRTIEVGDPAEVGFRSYVRGPEGEVLVARAGPHPLLDQPAAAFADRRLFSWPPDTLVAATLQGPDGELSVVRQDGSWLVDGRWRGDPERVAAWLRAWGSIRLEPGDGPLQGEHTLTLTRADGAMLTADLTLEGSEMRVALSDGRSGVASVEPSLVSLAPEPLAAVALLDLDRSTANAVGVRLGRVTWEGRRNGPAWQSALGEGASWDIVSALGALPQQPPPPRSRRSRPRRPWGVVTIVDGADRRVVVLGRARSDVHLVWQPGAERPVAVPVTAVEAVLAEIGTE